MSALPDLHQEVGMTWNFCVAEENNTATRYRMLVPKRSGKNIVKIFRVEEMSFPYQNQSCRREFVLGLSGIGKQHMSRLNSSITPLAQTEKEKKNCFWSEVKLCV